MLTEGNWPILDRDDDPDDLITVHHRDTDSQRYPNIAVMAILGDKVERYAHELGAEQLGVVDFVTRDCGIWQLDEQLCVAECPVGAPAAIMVMEDLARHGVERFIAVGSCGALRDFAEGEFMVPREALRDEGTSYHYVRESRWISTDREIGDACAQSLETRGFIPTDVKTWTTDALFRETPALVAARRAEGCDVVEMECASFAACAKFRGVRFGQMLFSADSLSSPNYEPRGWGRDSHLVALSLAHDAAKLLA